MNSSFTSGAGIAFGDTRSGVGSSVVEYLPYPYSLRTRPGSRSGLVSGIGSIGASSVLHCKSIFLLVTLETVETALCGAACSCLKSVSSAFSLETKSLFCNGRLQASKLQRMF